MTATATLKDTRIVGFLGHYYAQGRVYNDSRRRFHDGRPIVTSRIVFIHLIDGRYYLTTENSIYETAALELPDELEDAFDSCTSISLTRAGF